MRAAECPVCGDALKDSQLLPCLHSVCCLCWNDVKRLQSEFVFCPICYERFDPKTAAVSEATATGFCSTHENKPTSAVLCRRCNLLICQLCQTDPSAHFGHDLLTFEKCHVDLQNSETALIEKLRGINDALGVLSELKQTLSNHLISLCNEIVTTLERRFCDEPELVGQKHILNERCHYLVEQAHQNTRSDLKTLELQQINLEAYRDSLLTAIEQVKIMQQKGLDLSQQAIVLQMYAGVSTRLGTLLTMNPRLIPLVRNTLHFEIQRDAWGVDAGSLGYVGHGRDFSSIRLPTHTFGSQHLAVGNLRQPFGIAATQSSNLFVADNRRIQLFTPQGQLMRSIQGVVPLHVTVSEDRLWVSEYESNSISAFPLNGGSRMKTIACEKPAGIVALSNNFIVVTSNQSTIKQFSQDGKEIWSVDGHAFGLQEAAGLTMTTTGSICICDSAANCLLVISAIDGRFLYRIGSGQIMGPVSVASTPNGLLIVSERATDSISIWTNHGERVTSWGGNGSWAGLFQSCGCVCVLPDGRVAITDTENSRVQIF